MTERRSFKAVIFDMDGVLVDSEPVHIRAHERQLKDMGVTLDTSIIYENFIGSTALPMWTCLKETYDLPGTLEELMKTGRIYEREQEEMDGFPPIPGVKELVLSLKERGFLLAVASSSPLSRIRRTLEALSLTETFDALISGTGLKHPKPAPTPLEAARALNVNPAECLVIEDSENGVRAGKAAGMYVVGFKNPNSGRQDLSLSDEIITEFGQFDHF